MENNNIEGSLPSSLFELVNLKTLILDGNLLSGPLPEEITNLIYLGKPR